MRTHASRMHRSHCTFARRWACPSGQCSACLADFHDRRHLVDHLTAESPLCLLVLVMSQPERVDSITDPDFSAPPSVHKAGAQVLRRQRLVPTVRASGPLTEAATTVFEGARAGRMTVLQAREALIRCDPALSTEAADVLIASDVDAHLPAPPVEVSAERYPLILFHPLDYGGIAAEPLPCRVKRTEFFVLNLFSGRRRSGDIQSHIEWCHVSSDFSIHVLSIDIAIDPLKCNLMDASVLDEWVEHVRSRRAVCSGGGPPCETWSAARWAPGKGPPPLRSDEFFWGVPWTTARQADQLRVGNRLLHAVATLLAEHIAAGTSAWMEHPQPAEWEMKAASSYLWEPLRAVQASPAASTSDIDQCEHGHTSRAPTRFVAVRLPELPQRLTDTPGRGKCFHGRNAHRTLLGWDPDLREWRTARKKTYPPELCRALGSAIISAIALVFGDSDDVLPEDMADLSDAQDSLMRFYVRWDPYSGRG